MNLLHPGLTWLYVSDGRFNGCTLSHSIHLDNGLPFKPKSILHTFVKPQKLEVPFISPDYGAFAKGSLESTSWEMADRGKHLKVLKRIDS